MSDASCVGVIAAAYFGILVAFMVVVWRNTR